MISTEPQDITDGYIVSYFKEKGLNYEKELNFHFNKDLFLSNLMYDNSNTFILELFYHRQYNYYLCIKNTTTDEEFLIELYFQNPPLDILDVLTRIYENKNLDPEEIYLQVAIDYQFPQIYNILKSYNTKQDVLLLLKKLFTDIDKSYSKPEANNTYTKAKTQVMKEKIAEVKETIICSKTSDLKIDLLSNLRNRKNITKTRRILGEYLNLRHGIILRYDINTIYKLDKRGLGYNQIKFDDIIQILAKDLRSNLVSNVDLTEALSYISDRKKLEYNKVKFNNCIYDMKSQSIIIPEKPVFTITESLYDYNPAAQSTILKEFLETSLEKETPERTQKYIKGLLQVVGYSFTSGNPLNLLCFIVGVGGGGKSVFTNILTEIFGIDKVADLSLQELDTPHGTSSLIGKHLNVVRDADDRIVEAEDVLKQLSGNDPIQTNPKFKEAFTIPKEEVPKTYIVANAIPKFRKTSQSLLSRFLIIEFNKKFRGTNKEDKHLLDKILDNPEEIEWLIYQGLKEYKEMIDNDEDFILRLSEKDTKTMVEKYSKPVNYLVSRLILKHDPEAFEYGETQIFSEDLNKKCVKLAKLEGIEVKTNKKDLIDGRTLSKAIKEEFDLFDVKINNGEYKPIQDNNTKKRYYPDLIKDVEMWQYLDKTDIET